MVDSFNYLGTVFNYTGNFSLNQKYLVGKALKALNIRMYNCKKNPLTPKTQCQLFDSFVGSICVLLLLYVCVCVSERFSFGIITFLNKPVMCVLPRTFDKKMLYSHILLKTKLSDSQQHRLQTNLCSWLTIFVLYRIFKTRTNFGTKTKYWLKYLCWISSVNVYSQYLVLKLIQQGNTGSESLKTNTLRVVHVITN